MATGPAALYHKHMDAQHEPSQPDITQDAEFDPPITRIRLTDERLALELGVLEARFGMTNEEFLQRFNSGELGDDLEFIGWAGLLQIAAKTGLRVRSRA